MKLHFVCKLMLEKVIAYVLKKDFWILLRIILSTIFLCLELKIAVIIKCIFIMFLLSVTGQAGFCLC